MFSFGWSEIALTFIVIVIIIGPKEIPNLLRYIGSFTRSMRKITREFKASFDEIANDSKIKNSISEIDKLKKDLDPTKEINDQVESIKNTANIFENEIKDLNELNNKEKK